MIDPFNCNTHTIISSVAGTSPGTNIAYDYLGDCLGMAFTALTLPGTSTSATQYGQGSVAWTYDTGGRLTCEAWASASGSNVSFSPCTTGPET